MDIAVLLSFVAFGAAMVMIPGPDWAYLISVGANAGSDRRRSVAPAMAGLLGGYVTLMTLVVVGVGAIMATMPSAITAITVVGGCFIIMIGAKSVLSVRAAAPALAPVPTTTGAIPAVTGPIPTLTGPIPTVTGSLPALTGLDVSGPMASPSASPLSLFGRGFGVSSLNPNAIIILVTIFPQFTRADAALPVPAQLAVFAALFLVELTTVYSGVGYASSRLLSGRPGAARVTTVVAGCLMVCLGATLLIKRAMESGLIG